MKRKSIYSFFLQPILLLIILTGCADASTKETSLSSERIKELRQQYPVVSGSPPNVSSRDVSFAEILEITDAVVIAEVVKQNSNFHTDLTAKEGTPEWHFNEKTKSQGMQPYVPEFISYEVLIEDVLSGEPVEDTLDLFYNADFYGYEPDLKPGMRVLTAIMEGTGQNQEGKYSFTRYGTYYIVDDHYVLSAYEGQSEKVISFVAETNGKSLEFLIHTIEDLTDF
ncbi:hypothetical protein M3231_11130 [Neobacillus mesonae]|nr:hypothetical protein [Neobacillus mesonae]